ncbi:MAG: hypothetical protein JRD68_11100 [Deltaproteobacteria bacterium]|nr:hypothetical protein [Deltaproteobacteria bacterium]
MSLIRVLIIIGLFYLIYRVLKGLMSPAPLNRFKGNRPIRDAESDSDPEELMRDPNCGIYLPRKQGIAAFVGGRVFYFCSEECKRQYIEGRKKS